MPISFNQIPNNIRVPGAYVEIDNSKAYRGLSALATKILVIGQRRSVGTVLANVVTQVSNSKQAAEYFGVGSLLHSMIDALKANNKYTECFAIALDDVAGGVTASGSIVVTGPATASGTLSLYIAGKKLSVGVLNADTANTIAAAINAAINGEVTLPVTSTVSTNTVTVTARHKGEIGNEIDIRLNYLGQNAGEKTPAGVSLAITQLTGGTTNPDISTALAALDDTTYDFIVCPYNDSSSLTKLHNELDSRWGPLRMLEGHAFTARKGSVSALSTFGNAQNSQFITTLGVFNSPTPTYEVAAALGAVVAYYGTIDPARPFNTLPLNNVLAPPKQDLFSIEERNVLLYDGISTFTVNATGKVQIERLITNYQLNTSSISDPSYLDVNTMLTLSYLRQSLRGRLLSKFARYKLASDGTRVAAGQAVITPSVIKSEIIAWYSELESLAFVENSEVFKSELIVERNSNDPNRIDVLIPPDLVNQLNIIAAQIQFLL